MIIRDRLKGSPSFKTVFLSMIVLGLVSCRQQVAPLSLQPIVSSPSSSDNESAIADDFALVEADQVYSALELELPSKSVALQILEQQEISIYGVGPIKVGMTVEEAMQASKLDLVSTAEDVNGGCQYYVPQDSPDSFGFMVIEDQIIRVDVWANTSIKTKTGIGIGATESDIQAKYAERIEVTPHPYNPGNYLTFDPAEGGENLYQMVFETDSYGRVIQFRAGQFPAVTWSEGCS